MKRLYPVTTAIIVCLMLAAAPACPRKLDSFCLPASVMLSLAFLLARSLVDEEDKDFTVRSQVLKGGKL